MSHKTALYISITATVLTLISISLQLYKINQDLKKI